MSVHSDLEPFEWYLGYDIYRQLILENIPKEGKVMVAGCGNSYLMEDMVHTARHRDHGL